MENPLVVLGEHLGGFVFGIEYKALDLSPNEGTYEPARVEVFEVEQLPAVFLAEEEVVRNDDEAVVDSVNSVTQVEEEEVFPVNLRKHDQEVQQNHQQESSLEADFEEILRRNGGPNQAKRIKEKSYVKDLGQWNRRIYVDDVGGLVHKQHGPGVDQAVGSGVDRKKDQIQGFFFHSIINHTA